MDAVGKTSLWVAAMRAIESARPDRLLDDPFAKALAGDEGFAIQKAYLAEVGETPPVIPVRTRWLDQQIEQALGRGLSQLAILAAGMDARAFRLPFPEGVRLFEVDRREVLDYKQSRLGDALPRCLRQTVAADLRDDWPRALTAAGMRPEEPTVWLVEGLLVYLDEPSASALLTRIHALSAPGSSVFFDVSAQRLLDSPFLAKQKQFVERLGAPWRFGLDDPAAFLAGLGWQATTTDPADVSPSRWPLPRLPPSAGMRSFLVEGRRP